MKGIEAWVCHSTISLYLYEAWAKLSLRDARVFFAPGTPLLSEASPLRSELQNRSDVRPYTLRGILLLALASCLKGSRLRIRVPHLHKPTCHQILLLLTKLRFIRLDLYDDGFLGVVETPAVCNYLQPVFGSLYSWNIQGWKLSDTTLSRLSGRRGIQTMHFPLEELCDCWRQKHLVTEKDLLIIVESKYMDYDALNSLVDQKSQSAVHRSAPEVVPKCFEHPWEIKRNNSWPPNRERELVREVPVERYLARAVASDTHVITGMSSTAVLLCDLIRKKALPRCRITLLLCTMNADRDYHSSDELHSYIRFMKDMYSSVVDLEIVLDGEQLRL